MTFALGRIWRGKRNPGAPQNPTSLGLFRNHNVQPTQRLANATLSSLRRFLCSWKIIWKLSSPLCWLADVPQRESEAYHTLQGISGLGPRKGRGMEVGGDGSGKERHSITSDGRRELTSGAQERDGKTFATEPGAPGPLGPPAFPSAL